MQDYNPAGNSKQLRYLSNLNYIRPYEFNGLTVALSKHNDN